MSNGGRQVAKVMANSNNSNQLDLTTSSGKTGPCELTSTSKREFGGDYCNGTHKSPAEHGLERKKSMSGLLKKTGDEKVFPTKSPSPDRPTKKLYPTSVPTAKSAAASVIQMAVKQGEFDPKVGLSVQSMQQKENTQSKDDATSNLFRSKKHNNSRGSSSSSSSFGSQSIFE